MSRSHYSDDLDLPALALWRGAVGSAIRGKRGQSFLRDLRGALDRLPEPKHLIAHDLERDGEVCAMGSVLRERKIDMGALDPEEPTDIAAALNIARALAMEVAYLNDEEGNAIETQEQRYVRVSAWVDINLATTDRSIACV